ncbi:hypothetical protein Pcinc_033928 [Petrolisthes cinctipes]|uniref:Uncharacterized protein n=1 Tax=Petrolisthes cinctipes TaxID=88211 RepID=A0AAE1K0W3_PETCI|nr:hypothetical protein Pcinc_033928 [Petrolisthes cinctipes]
MMTWRTRKQVLLRYCCCCCVVLLLLLVTTAGAQDTPQQTREDDGSKNTDTYRPITPALAPVTLTSGRARSIDARTEFGRDRNSDQWPWRSDPRGKGDQFLSKAQKEALKFLGRDNPFYLETKS